MSLPKNYYSLRSSNYYNIATWSTDPDMVRFACMNGITQNPLYMKCDACGNSICHVRQGILESESLQDTLDNTQKMLALIDEEKAFEEYAKNNPIENLPYEEYMKAAEERQKIRDDFQRKIEACIK